MNEFNFEGWYAILLKSLEEFTVLVSGFLPKLIGALMLYIIGKIVAKLVKKAVIKLFQITKLNVLLTKTKINEMLEKTGLNISFEEFIGGIVYWSILLIFLMSAAEVIGIQIISNTIAQLVSYLPNVIASIIVVVITSFIARLMKDITKNSLTNINIEYAGSIGSVAYILIMIFGMTIALTQFGIDVSIITTNVTVIISGFVLAALITFSISSLSTISNLISGYYVKKQFKETDEIQIGELQGKIKSMQKVNLILETNNKDLIIPYSRIMKSGSL